MFVDSAAALAGQISAVVQFNISEGRGSDSYVWMLNMATGTDPSVHGKVHQPDGPKNDEKYDVRISCSDATLESLSNGKLSPEFAYMKGQLEIRGNMSVALRVRHALSAAAKLLQ